MADKKTTQTKIVLERDYNVPLRSGWLKAPKYKRSKKAVTTLREFLIKHMKSANVKIGKILNDHIWKDGIKNPPHHVKVHVTKDEEGIVKAELEGHNFKEAVKAKPKVEKATGLKGKLKDALDATKSDKEEVAEEAPKTEAKKAEVKEEIKATPVKKEEAKVASNSETVDASKHKVLNEVKATPKKEAVAKTETVTEKKE